MNSLVETLTNWSASFSALDVKVKAPVSLLVAYFLSRVIFGKKAKRPMDEATRQLLRSPEAVEADCVAIVKTLTSFAVVQDEATCAEHMREIVKSKALPYESLAENPIALLGASRHFSPARNGALGTRFTVQYNLFAGSIVAMGSDEQREILYKVNYILCICITRDFGSHLLHI
jgi:hypothetical protein